MKRLILLAGLAAAMAAPAAAAVPQKIGYQGFLRESGGLAVGNKRMRFKIYPSSDAAAAVFDSGEMTVTVSTGVFHVTLDVTGVDLEANTAWLELAVGNASASNVLSPREQLTASAYALNAFRHEGKRFISSGTAPGGTLSPGDLWFDNASNVLYYRAAGSWVTTAGAGLPVAHAITHAQSGTDPITSLGGVTFTANVGFGGAPSATKIDVQGDAQFGSLAKSTFAAAGGLFIARGSSITLSGPTGWIVAQSSIAASGFFGDGSGLTNVSGVTAGTIDSAKLAKNSVDSEKIVNLSIDRNHLRAGAVDTAKLAADSVDSAKLLSNPASLAKVSGGAMSVSGASVGIGTVGPAARLDVSGDAQFGSGAQKSTFTATGALNLASGQHLTLAGGGKVTGLADPVADTDAAPRKWVLDNAGASGGGWTRTGAAIAPTNSGDTVTIGSTLTVQGNAFSVGGATLAAAGGRVGVGTANPEYQFQVRGAAAAVALKPGTRSYVIDTDDAGGQIRLGRSDVAGLLSVTPKAAGARLGVESFGSRLVLSGGNELYVNAGESGAGGNIVFGKRDVDELVLPSVYQFWGGNVTVVSTLTVQGNAFSVGGSTLVVSGGNVTVGRPNPIGKFDVFDSGVSETILAAVVLGGTGRVGMGTAAPNYKVQVNSPGAGTTYLQMTHGGTGAGSPDGLLLGFPSGAGARLMNQENAPLELGANGQVLMTLAAGGNIGVSSAAPAGLFTVGDGTMVVTGAGRVGIGTSVPDARLHVSGGELLMDNDRILSWKNAGGAARSVLRVDTADNIFLGRGGLGDLQVAPGGNVTFHDGAVLNENARINVDGSGSLGRSSQVSWTTAGNVGIGTPSPTHKLRVAGGILATSSITASAGFYGDGSNITGVNATDVGSPVSMDIVNAKTATTNGGVTITSHAFVSAGRLGVGTVLPGAGLHVKGASDLKQVIVQAAPIQTANLIEWQDNAGSAQGRIFGNKLETGAIYASAGIGGGNNGFSFSNGAGSTYDNLNYDTARAVWLWSNAAPWGTASASASNILRGAAGQTADILQVQNSASSSLLRVAPAGEVGIGTARPAAKLHMSSGTLLVDGDAATALRVGVSSFVVTSEGRVGVGLSNPQSGRLHVSGGNAYFGPYSESGESPTSQGRLSVSGDIAELTLQDRSAGSWSATNRWSLYSPDGILRIWRNGDKVAVDGSGNVGIGSVAPASKLHMSTGTLTVDGVSGNTQSAVVIGTQPLTTGAMLQVGNATFTVLQSGNVGIGTASPAFRLHVDVPGSDNIGMRLSAIATAKFIDLYPHTEMLKFSNSATVRSGSGQSIRLEPNDGGGASSNLLYLSAAGNVGIGTTNPTYKLDVGGDAVVRSSLTYAGALAADPAATAGQGALYYNTATNKLRVLQNAAWSDLGTGVAGGGWTDDGAVVRLSGATDNVGIGTASPNEGLWGAFSPVLSVGTLTGTGGVVELLGNQGADGALGRVAWFNGNTLAPRPVLAEIQGHRSVDNNSGALAFRTTSLGTSGERMRIDKLGNVGIGTASPGSLFTVGADMFRIDSSGRVGVGTFPETDRLFTSNNTITGANPRGIQLNNLFVPSNAASSVFFNVNAAVNPPSGGTATTYGVNVEDIFIGNVAGTISDLIGMRVAPFSGKGALATVTNQYQAQLLLPTNGSNNKIGVLIGAAPAGPVTHSLHVASGNSYFGGNVGIGTTQPATKLHMSSGTLTVDGVTGNTQPAVVIGTQPLITNAMLQVGNATFTVLQDGRVGVGRANPAALLDVGGEIILRTPDGPSAGTIQIQTGRIGNAAAYLEILTDGGGAGNGKTHIGSWQNDVTYLQSAGGNVGIGTTAPATKLHLSTGVLTVDGTNGNVQSGVAIGTQPLITGAMLQVGNATFTVLQGGNVGIGTPAPGALLEIAGDGGTVLLPRKSAAGDPASPTNGMMYYNSSANKFRCYQGGVWADCLAGGSSQWTTSASDIYYNTGNVGIGSVAPATKLHMSTGTLTVNGVSGNTQSAVVIGTQPLVAGAMLQVGNATFTVLQSGNIGIGTTSPGAKLHIDSTANTSVTLMTLESEVDNAGEYNEILALGAGGAKMGAIRFYHNVPAGSSDTEMRFLTQTAADSLTEQMVIKHDGNVGIGTTGPGLTGVTKALTVSGGTSGSVTGGVEIQGSAIGADNNFSHVEFYNGAIRAASIQGYRSGADNSARLDFLTTNAGALGTPDMTILPNGNVGIGTTGPDTSISGRVLELRGSIPLQAVLRVTSDDANPYFIIKSGLATPAHGFIRFEDGDTSSYAQIVGENNNNALRFDTNGVAGQMYINSSGNVGIGNTSPTEAKLMIAKAAAGTPSLRIGDAATGSLSLEAYQSGHIFNEIKAGTNESIVLNTAGSGNVGINCNDPDNDLEVGGTGVGCNTGTGSFMNAGATAFTANSSRIWKENITPFTRPNILEAIRNVPVTTYDWKPEHCSDGDKKCKNKLGLIAEDFYTIFRRGSDKRIDGQEVDMALWLAVQELAKGLTMMTSGNRGIGTTSPQDQLDVANNISMGGCLRNEAHTTTYSGTCMSDARLKISVRPLQGALEKLSKLNPVSFEFEDQAYGRGAQEGLLAQEVEKIFPKWVATGPDGYKKVAYGTVEFQMLLLEALKELQAENVRLQERVGVLEGRRRSRAGGMAGSLGN